MAEKVVLAYSGGLDTSIIIPWLNENYGYDVIAFVADVGQGDDIDAVVAKAYKTGAKKVIVKDLREEFLNEYVFPTVRAGAVYEHKYLLGTSIARPIIAKHQVEVALREGGSNNGEPGPRPDYGPDYYGAFIFDLDGNKIEATVLNVVIPKAQAAKKSARKAARKTVAKKKAKKAPAKKAKKKKARR